MNFFSGALHIINFFLPAMVVALLTSVGAKLFWRQDLRAASFLRLWGLSSVSSCLALGAGLLVWGRDGKMVTYGLMLLACSTTVAWLGRLGAGR